jgi:hypothetical protein
MGDSESVYVVLLPSHAFAPHARCRRRATPAQSAAPGAIFRNPKAFLTEVIEIAVPRDRARIPTSAVNYAR